MTIEDAMLEIERLGQQNADLQDSLDSAEKEVSELETKLENKRTSPLDHQVLQLKHPRLFTGDLSRLTHADRRELFEEIYNFEGRSDALSSIEHRIS